MERTQWEVGEDLLGFVPGVFPEDRRDARVPPRLVETLTRMIERVPWFSNPFEEGTVGRPRP